MGINLDIERVRQLVEEDGEWTCQRTLAKLLLAYIDDNAPRTITTLDEWHELPYGSVIIGRLGEVILKDELGQDYGFMPYRLGGISEDVDGEFPATVVHTPTN